MPKRTWAVVQVPFLFFALCFGFATLYEPPVDMSKPMNWLEALYFSLVTMATVGFGDITPAGVREKITVMVQIVSALMLLVVAIPLVMSRFSVIDQGETQVQPAAVIPAAEKTPVPAGEADRGFLPLWFMQLVQTVGVFGVICTVIALLIQNKQLEFATERRDQDRRVREATLTELSWSALSRAVGKEYEQGQTMAIQNLAMLKALPGSTLSKLSFLDPDIEKAELEGIKIEDSGIYGGNLRSTNFKEATLHEVRLKDVDLVGVNASSAELINTILHNSVSDKADFSDATVSKLDLVGGSSKESKWKNSQITNSWFRDTSLKGADFSGALLAGVDFERVDLTDANFSGAKIIAINFERVKGLKPNQLQDACQISHDVTLVAITEVVIRRYTTGFPSISSPEDLAKSDLNYGARFPKGVLPPPECKETPTEIQIYFGNDAADYLLRRTAEGIPLWRKPNEPKTKF